MAEMEGKLIMRFWGPGDRFAVVLRFREVVEGQLRHRFSVATTVPGQGMDGFKRLSVARAYARKVVGLPVDDIAIVPSQEAA